MNLFVTATAFSNQADIIAGLHTPVGAARRIAFLSTATPSAISLINQVAGAYQSVPGRRVLVQSVTDLTPDSRATTRNAEIVLTDYGVLEHLDDPRVLVEQEHALCLVTPAVRSTADPTVALALSLMAEQGLATLVALCPTTRFDRNSGWARKAEQVLPDRTFFMSQAPASRKQLAVSKLAAALLTASVKGEKR